MSFLEVRHDGPKAFENVALLIAQSRVVGSLTCPLSVPGGLPNCGLLLTPFDCCLPEPTIECVSGRRPITYAQFLLGHVLTVGPRRLLGRRALGTLKSPQARLQLLSRCKSAKMACLRMKLLGVGSINDHRSATLDPIFEIERR